MSSSTRTPAPDRRDTSETIVSAPAGRGRQLALHRPRQAQPFLHVRFDPLHRRARIGALRVRRRHFLSSDLWLVDPEQGPIAVAQKRSWPLGLRYELEWSAGGLFLSGARGPFAWQVFAGEEVVGDLVDVAGERRLTMPSGTPDEVCGFVVALAEMVRHNPVLLLFDRMFRPFAWPS